jgi:hypothetical protein
LSEVDVEFRTHEESSVEPPNPDYLKFHAALAKVLHLCGVAEYIERVERDAELEGTLRLNGETDIASYLQSKFVVLCKGGGKPSNTRIESSDKTESGIEYIS